MSVQYRCDQCAEVADAPAAVGWVEVRQLGGHALLPPDPVHLCRLCWARTGTAATDPCPAGTAPQLSEHVQNRDTVQ
ncbi:hypothetical protein GCU67_09750 [Modestobacter muralis]|uniref:Uncharacterized protein n=1 Tax=Modestobacter muralis TaxID=1608614 RepID=A0A6P0H6J4_9ACTN|nr:hypothetical protein [Modestobacter muralis]NEK94453.1 hypothetical protein [Modestobacter muralis]NEN51341.1 hypothetical protein [Modestobacter muralis]